MQRFILGIRLDRLIGVAYEKVNFEQESRTKHK